MHEKKSLLDYFFNLIMSGVVIVISSLSISEAKPVISLPEPILDSDVSLEETLSQRRSVRDFTLDSLSLTELSQLLWSCQGISSNDGHRTAPSAGALYPLEIFIVVDRVQGLRQGLYHYRPGPGINKHSLEHIGSDVNASKLALAALDQDCIRDAAVNIIIAAVISRTAKKYGERSERYVQIEVGHAAQNVCLQAQVLRLGVVTVGAFSDSAVQKLLAIDAKPIYILPVGRAAP